MEYKDITEMVDLAENADKIAVMVEKYGFCVMLGREEEFINNKFEKINELDRRRLIKTIKEINPKIHHEFGLI